MARSKTIVDVFINTEEAIANLNKLNADISHYNKLKKEAFNAGNTELVNQLNEEIKKLSRDANTYKRLAIDVKDVLKNLNKAPLDQLQASQKLLRAQLQRLDRDTKDYAETLDKIRLIEDEIYRTRKENKNTPAVTDKSAVSATEAPRGKKGTSLLTKAVGVVGGAYALESIAEKSIEVYARLDDKIADVQKTTGLTKDEVKELDAALMKLDTRSSREELLDLARVAGKLGISGREAIEGFVKASDKIKIALSEDLGGDIEESIGKIGKLSTIFGVKEAMGIEQSMLSIGSAINTLGASSVANEGYIVEFASRTAGIAPGAGISIENIMGLGAALDNLGVTAEVSGTAYSQVISKMFKDTGKYASIANMSVGEFTELLNTDTNEAFLKFLEGLNKMNTGDKTKTLASLSLEGAGATKVMGALSGKVGLVREQQHIANEEFAKGTSLLDEFNTKNNSAQKTLETNKKHRDEAIAALGESLFPLWSDGLRLQGSLISAFSTLVSWILQYKNTLITVTSVIIAYNILKKAQAFWCEAHRLALLEELATLKVNVATTNTAATSTKLLTAAKLLLTGQVKAAGTAFKMFWASIGPIGWLAIAVGAVATAFTGIATAVIKTRKEKELLAGVITSEVNKSLAEETAKLNALKEQLKDSEPGSKMRIELIKQIKKEYPGLLNNIDAEKASINSLISSIDTYLLKSKDRIRAQVLEGKIVDNIKDLEDARIKLTSNEIDRNKFSGIEQRIERENELLAEQLKYQKDLVIYGEEYANTVKRRDEALLDKKEAEKTFSSIQGSVNISSKIEQQQLNKAEWEKMEETRLSDGLKIGKKYKKVSYNDYIETLKSMSKSNKEAEKNVAEAKKEFDRSSKFVDDLNKDIEKKQISLKEDSGDSYSSSTANRKQKTLENDVDFTNKRIALRKQLLAGEIATEQEHDTALLKLEIESLASMLSSTKLTDGERAKLEQSLAEKRYKQLKTEQEREKKLLSASYEGSGGESVKSQTEQQQIEYNEKLTALGLYNKAIADMTESERRAALNLERNHLASLRAIYMDDVIKTIKDKEAVATREVDELKISHNNTLAALKDFESKKSLLKEWFSDKDIAKIDTEKQADALIRKKFEEQERQQLEAHLKGLINDYQNYIDEAKKISTDGVDLGILTPEEVAKVKTLIDELNKKLSELKPSGADIPEKSAGNVRVDALGFSVDDWQGLFKNIEAGKIGLEGWNMVLQTVGNTFSEISSIMAAAEQREFKLYEKTANKKKRTLEKQLRSGTISQERYNDSIRTIDEETDRKRQEMERKQAARQKMLSSFQAAVNTAVAITAILGSTPPGPWNIALAAVVGALGAAQIAMILATPLPGAEDGGYISAVRSQDGKPFKARYTPDKRGFVDGPSVIVGENGTEYIVNNTAYKNPTIRPVLDIIDAATRNNTVGSIDLPAAINSTMPGRVSGGYITPKISAKTSGDGIYSHERSSGDSDTMSLLVAVLDKLSSNLDKPQNAIVRQRGPGGLLEAEKKYKRIRKTL